MSVKIVKTNRKYYLSYFGKRNANFEHNVFLYIAGLPRYTVTFW